MNFFVYIRLSLVEKTELLKRLSVYALSKVLLILSWHINLNSGPVHEIQNENLLHVLPFHDCNFSGDDFYYNPNRENESMNEWNVFKQRGVHFIHMNINSLLPKIDEVRYIANKPMRLLLE